MGYCAINGGTERVCLAGLLASCVNKCTRGARLPSIWRWTMGWPVGTPQDHPHKLRLDEHAAMGGVSDGETDDGMYLEEKGWQWLAMGTFNPSTDKHDDGDWIRARFRSPIHLATTN